MKKSVDLFAILCYNKLYCAYYLYKNLCSKTDKNGAFSELLNGGIESELSAYYAKAKKRGILKSW